MKNLYRHGDVIIKQIEKKPTKAKKLDTLILAEGEATGHYHRISEGEAALYSYDDKKYLEIQSEIGLLTHEEHKALELPHGTYEIIIQREYDDEQEWRNVID